MAKLVEFALGNDETILIEAEAEDVDSDGIEPVSKRPGDAVQARQSFNEALLDGIAPVVSPVRVMAPPTSTPTPTINLPTSDCGAGLGFISLADAALHLVTTTPVGIVAA